MHPIPRLCSISQFALYIAIICIALFLCCVAAPVAAQSPEPPPDAPVGAPLTLAEYHAEVVAAIAELQGAQQDDIEMALEKVQTRFTAITQVEYPSGEVVNVVSLLADLKSEEGDVSDESGASDESSTEDAFQMPVRREIAIARLRGAVAQMDAAANDNTRVRLALLDEILARPEFNDPQSLWDRLWQWLRNLFNDWLPDRQTGAGSGLLAWLLRAVPWIVSVLIVAAIIWLLSYWLQRLLHSFVTDARIHSLAGDDDLPRSAAEARQQARAAAHSGHYRDAVRRLYLAALLQLAEHDLIDYERSLTNREVLVRVPADSPIRPHLEPVIATFDQVWYGVREPDQQTFNAYEAEIDALAQVASEAAANPAHQTAHQPMRAGGA